MSGLVFVCLDLHFRCLDLYFRCLDLYFRCLDLYFRCLYLYFRCLDLYFGCLNWYFGCLHTCRMWLWRARSGGGGRAAGGPIPVWGSCRFAGIHFQESDLRFEQNLNLSASVKPSDFECFSSVIKRTLPYSRPVPKTGWRRGSILGFSLKKKCCYINGHHKQYILVDTIFNYIFHFGLPGKCLYLSPQNTPFGAIHV